MSPELCPRNYKVNLDISKLYDIIDIIEMLSNLRGEEIKHIASYYVALEDSKKVDIKHLHDRLIKPFMVVINEKS